MKGNFIFSLPSLILVQVCQWAVEWADVSGDWHFELQLLVRDREYWVVLKALRELNKLSVTHTHILIYCVGGVSGIQMKRWFLGSFECLSSKGEPVLWCSCCK